MTGRSACLVAIVHGVDYERHAAELMESARTLFVPTDAVECIVLRGRAGWPDATLYRYHVLLEQQARLDHDYVFLTDADMRFESTVGPEILSPLTATRHPGFVTAERCKLPYERRPESAACVPQGSGSVYYAGGFVGGRRDTFLELAETVAAAIDRDDRVGVVAQWHDESHLNRALIDSPPFRSLTPSYCYPDDDTHYLGLWRDHYPRRLIAVDKIPSTR
jgi:hypothetical protein